MDIVYLFGAGASHANAAALGSTHGTLMRDLKPALDEGVRSLAQSRRFRDHQSVQRLANEVMTNDQIDIEQIITFLEDSRSTVHQEFAMKLKRLFAEVLRDRLTKIERELGNPPTDLYSAVLDMHQVNGFGEHLRGILTLNYDLFLEHSIERVLNAQVDYGINVTRRRSAPTTIKLLKLHGSFGWADSWPILASSNLRRQMWIPPGIQKEKSRYPFNVLWGMARELLECDVLRIIGCNLGKNDWDLVSLLFTTQHAHRSKAPYAVEIIDLPERAEDIKRQFPQLAALSLFELDTIGDLVVSEIGGGPPRSYDDLLDEERSDLIKRATANISNPFLYWLKQKAETMYQDPSLATINTPSKALAKILEEY
jgi:hypothetical protein